MDEKKAKEINEFIKQLSNEERTETLKVLNEYIIKEKHLTT